MVDLAVEPLESASETPRRCWERSPTIPTTRLLVDAPAVAQLGEPALRALADEHVDRPLALEQQLDQVAADEAGCAGDEVPHVQLLRVAENRVGPYTLTPIPGARQRDVHTMLEATAPRERWMSMSVSIVWFRRDLRLADNPALAAAAAAGRGRAGLLLRGGPQRAGGTARPTATPTCSPRCGSSTKACAPPARGSTSASATPPCELRRLAAECGRRRVHVNRDHTAHARERDRRVAVRARGRTGRAGRPRPGSPAPSPPRIVTGAGSPYRVFTPFSRAWLAAPRREPSPQPRKLDAPLARAIAAGSRRRARRRSEIDAGRQADRRGRRPRRGARPEADAHGRRSGAGDYTRVRDLPGLDATTRLSPPPALRDGLGPRARDAAGRQAQRRARRRCAGSSPGATSGSA